MFIKYIVRRDNVSIRGSITTVYRIVIFDSPKQTRVYLKNLIIEIHISLVKCIYELVIPVLCLLFNILSV